MSKDLLSQVIIALVNEHAAAKDYGVSLVTIPDFDYAKLACSIEPSRQVQFFFLGFSKEQEASLTSSLPELSPKVSYAFTVEAAEESRNSGDENVFRILVIK